MQLDALTVDRNQFAFVLESLPEHNGDKKERSKLLSRVEVSHDQASEADVASLFWQDVMLLSWLTQRKVSYWYAVLSTVKLTALSDGDVWSMGS